MDDHIREGHLAHQLEAGPDHPVLPEPDDLARRRVDVARVVRRELGRLVRPAERRKRPQRRREPRVENVGVTRQRDPGARALLRLLLRGRADRLAVRRRPDRELVTPPELARQAPVGASPPARRSRTGAATRGGSARAARASASIAGRAGSSIVHHHCSEISGSMREWHRSHVPDRVAVVLALDELPSLLDPGDNGRIGLGLRQPCEITGLVAHPAVEPDHHRLRQARGRDRSRSRVDRGRA